MSLFIESIRVFNGEADNLPRHQARVAATFARFFSGKIAFSLKKVIDEAKIDLHDLLKLRIVYDTKVQMVSFEPYIHPQFEKYTFIEIPDNFQYNFKYAERSLFEQIGDSLPKGVLPLLVHRNRVTDATFSNLIFSKNGVWYSPANPLLAGTRLKSLVASGKVLLHEISPNDIMEYDQIIPINSMNSPGEAGLISTKELFLG